MLKRTILFTLALLLAIGSVGFAQETAEPITRVETIYLEGMPEEIVTTYFESEFGYAFWYDAECMKPLLRPWGEFESPLHERIDYERVDESFTLDIFVPANPNVISPIYLEIYTGLVYYSMEDRVRDTLFIMELKLDHAEEGEIGDLFANYDARVIWAQDGELSIYKYIVAEYDELFTLLTLVYPQEVAEGYGSRIHQMLKSFEILEK